MVWVSWHLRGCPSPSSMDRHGLGASPPAQCAGRRSGRRGGWQKEQLVASLTVCTGWGGKLGSMRYTFRRINTDEVALKVIASGVDFLSQNQCPVPAGRGALPQGELGQVVVANTSTSLSNRPGHGDRNTLTLKGKGIVSLALRISGVRQFGGTRDSQAFESKCF